MIIIPEIREGCAPSDCKHHVELRHRMGQIARLTYENEILKRELEKKIKKIKRLESMVRKLKDPLLGAMIVANEKSHD